MPGNAVSPRREELLDRAYRYVLEHGLIDVSLRPLAATIGSSPRVLLFLFGSKDELVRAILARARADELSSLTAFGTDDLHETARALWRWLSAPAHRPLLVLWLEAYSRSLTHPNGPWADFARDTVSDWLSLLAATQSPSDRSLAEGTTQRSLILAVLRGALLDLLATGDTRRTTAAVEHAILRRS